MPYFYALIEAAEREAMLSHPHAVEGFGMGEGFAELLGASANLPPYRIAFFVSEGWLIRRPMRPAPPEKAA